MKLRAMPLLLALGDKWVRSDGLYELEGVLPLAKVRGR